MRRKWKRQWGPAVHHAEHVPAAADAVVWRRRTDGRIENLAGVDEVSFKAEFYFGDHMTGLNIFE